MGKPRKPASSQLSPHPNNIDLARDAHVEPDRSMVLAMQAAADESTTLRNRRWSVLAQQFALTLFLVLLGAAIQELMPFDQASLNRTSWLVPSTVLLTVLVAVLSWRSAANQLKIARAGQLAPADLHLQLQESQHKIERLTEHGARLIAWCHLQHQVELTVANCETDLLQLLSSMRDQVLEPNAIRSEVHARVDKVLDLLVGYLEKQRSALFGYTQAEVYFFDIFEVRAKQLHRVARRCSKKHPDGSRVEQHDRTFPISEGDVGDCVFKGATICVDYSKERRNQSATLYRSSDDRNFACRLSTPIVAPGAGPHSAFGAFCFTSSDPARLTTDFHLVVENLSWPIARLFSVRSQCEREIEVYRAERSRLR